jgi:hypothetical protein
MLGEGTCNDTRSLALKVPHLQAEFSEIRNGLLEIVRCRDISHADIIIKGCLLVLCDTSRVRVWRVACFPYNTFHVL